ncbi:MAG: ATPase, T2SS/T4P/T4SS family [Alkaliphilus sp.]
MIITRIEDRALEIEQTDKKVYVSLYEVIEKIASEVVQKHKDLVQDITLSVSRKNALEPVLLKIIVNNNYRVSGVNREKLIKETIDHILGYGIVQKYLDLDDCSGVFINSYNNVWAKVGSDVIRTDVSFGNESNLRSYIQTAIQSNLGGDLNQDKALVKFEDKYNKLRIICAVPPVAMNSMVVFRKHRGEAFNLEDLIKIGMLTEEMAVDLTKYIRAGANIVFCGRGAAGKTTIMRALLETLPEQKRLLVMEEHNELFLKHPNAMHMLVKRNELGHIYGIKELSDMGLLMSVDTYVYGEIRGEEALEFFNGAFAGNMTVNTVHAGSAKKAIRKLMINMKMSGTNLSDEVLLEMLYESINIIIFLDSFTIVEIVEVINLERTTNKLWEFEIERREPTFIVGKHKKINEIKSEEMILKILQTGGG